MMFKKIGKKFKTIVVVAALVAALTANIAIMKILNKKEKDLKATQTTVTLTKDYQADAVKALNSITEIDDKIKTATAVSTGALTLYTKNKFIEAEEKANQAKALHESILSELNEMSFKDLYMKWQILRAEIKADPELSETCEEELRKVEELLKSSINKKKELLTSCSEHMKNIDKLLNILRTK